MAALAEPLPDGPSTRRLSELPRRRRITLGAGLVEAAGACVFHNSYVVALPAGTIHCHRKLHPFERRAIRDGTDYTLFDSPEGFRVGVLICSDCYLIENVRINALRGAEILLVPHQTGAVCSKNPQLMGLIDRRHWHNRHHDPAAIEH